MPKLTPSQIRSYWLSAGGGSNVVKSTSGPIALDVLMTAISLAESREGDPAAINPGVGAGGRRTNEYSVGLWQINTWVHKRFTVDQLKDPAINASEAVRIYRLQGLRAWGAYTDGRYRSFLNRAGASSVSVIGVPGVAAQSSSLSLSSLLIPAVVLLAVVLLDD